MCCGSMSNRSDWLNALYLAIGVLFGYCICSSFAKEKAPVEVIKKQLIHRTDTLRIIDSAVAIRKARVHKLSKEQVKQEFEEAFTPTDADSVDTAVDSTLDTMTVTVAQAKECLELVAQTQGDSAKLAVDDRTLGVVQQQVDSLNVEQKHSWRDIATGVGIGALATLLLMLGAR